MSKQHPVFALNNTALLFAALADAQARNEEENRGKRLRTASDQLPVKWRHLGASDDTLWNGRALSGAEFQISAGFDRPAAPMGIPVLLLRSNLRTACHLLKSLRVDMVLCNTHLSDGTGFGLLGDLAGLPVTVFLCLPVETRLAVCGCLQSILGRIVWDCQPSDLRSLCEHSKK